MVPWALRTSVLRPFCPAFWKIKHSRQLSWNVACLPKRRLIKVAGPDARSFLQGLITADIYGIEDPRPALFSLMLNVQGRVLFDIIIYKLPTVGQTNCDYRLEVDGTLNDQLLQHARQYRMRKKVDIVDVGDHEQVWVALAAGSESQQQQQQSLTVPAVSPAVRAFADPRLRELGFRLLAPTSLQSAGALLADARNTSSDDYDALRHQLGVGEGPVDHPVGKALPLENNVVFLNGVSFSKGCYIGQELTARSHHTGVIRKRLMPVDFASSEDASRATFDDDIRDADGSSVGKFRSAAGKWGLALLRHEAALRPGADLHIVTSHGDRLTVVARRPAWWPATDPPVSA